MTLDWRRDLYRDNAWVADGVYDNQWYSVARAHEKRWAAVFHDDDEVDGPLTQRLGQGTFNEAKRLCRDHAGRVQ